MISKVVFSKKIFFLFQDLEVNVAFGKEIVLKNVKLKESALRDAGLPLRLVNISVKQRVLPDPNPTYLDIFNQF